tara:strand:- start:273 stop:569 length:297 start_codon:yes stop_codon:yes gene_type:complete
MTSLDDKLHSLKGKVADLDTLDYQASDSDTSNKTYSQYIYILVIFLVLLAVLIWLKPSFLTYKDEKENKVYINKTRMGVAATVLTGSIVGGWYWYSKK